MMAYSVATNRREAVASAKLRLGSTDALKWYRFDDGVMGGRSSTQHTTEGGALTFAGMLDTRGGGFTSVRADFAGGLKSAMPERALPRRWEDVQGFTVERARRRPVVEQPVLAARPAHEARRGAVRDFTIVGFVPSFGGQRNASHAGSLNPKAWPRSAHALFVSERRLAELRKNLRAEGHDGRLSD